MMERTWIERNRSWIKVFASPHPMLNILYVSPILAWLGIIGAPWIVENLISAALLFALGLLYWSFIEYGIHRWIYHGKFKDKKVRELIESFHIYHHRNLEDNSVLTAGPFMIFPLAVSLLTPVWIASDAHTGVFASISLGTLGYYLFYEWVHYSIHRRTPTNRYYKWITEYHLDHHKYWAVKFGNTISLWDHLLGTFEKKESK